MKRYTLKVTKTGTRMDDDQLFNLEITDTTITVEYLKSTVYESLSEFELNKYVIRYEGVTC